MDIYKMFYLRPAFVWRYPYSRSNWQVLARAKMWWPLKPIKPSKLLSIEPPCQLFVLIFRFEHLRCSCFYGQHRFTSVAFLASCLTGSTYFSFRSYQPKVDSSFASCPRFCSQFIIHGRSQTECVINNDNKACMRCFLLIKRRWKVSVWMVVLEICHLSCSPSWIRCLGWLGEFPVLVQSLDLCEKSWTG